MKSQWDERYAADEYVYGTEPNDFLREVARRIPQGPVLLLAEGEGRNAVHLAELGYEVTALDQSAPGLAKAQRLAAQRGVELTTLEADLADYEIEPGAWSGIVAIFMHLPPELRARILGQVGRGLRPGGVFVMEAYTPAQLTHRTGGPPVRELLVTLEELRSELGAEQPAVSVQEGARPTEGVEQSLTLAHRAELERDIHEGRLHHGRSAVAQVVAVKG